MNRLCLFVHPLGGSGRAENRLQLILNTNNPALQKAGVSRVDSIDRAVSELRNLSHRTTVVAAGGDGTANLMVQALRRAGMKERPLALLPLGTGNALAHALGVGNVRDAIETLGSHRIRTMDIFGTSHPAAPVALCTLSLGYEARILKGVAARTSRSRLLLGARAALHGVGRHQRGARAAVDGRVVLDARDRFFNFGLYNIPNYAFGRMVHPEADPGDGSGNAVLHRAALSYWKDFLGLPSDPESSISFLSGRVDSDLPIQVDGESVAGGSFEFWVEPGALRFLVPAT